MRQDLGRVPVGFQHHSPHPTRLDRGNAASDVFEGSGYIFRLSTFSGFLNQGRIELERVRHGVDDRLRHGGGTIASVISVMEGAEELLIGDEVNITMNRNQLSFILTLSLKLKTRSAFIRRFRILQDMSGLYHPLHERTMW